MKVQLPVRKAILLRRTYEAPAEGRANKIRLDFNENTTGCSAAARKALARLTAKQIATYPEYAAPTRRLARYFRVHPEELLLTNGGDDALRVFFDTFVEPRTSDRESRWPITAPRRNPAMPSALENVRATKR